MVRYVGLDVHKRSVAVCVLDQNGHKLWRKCVDCTRPALLDFARGHLTKDDHVALEATTNTWAVAGLLKPLVGSLTVGNPLKTKAIAEAKVKTDKVDSEVLAQLLRCDYLPPVWQPDDKTQQLRKLTGARAALVSDRSMYKNRIQSLLAQLLVVPPVKHLWTQAGLEWLRRVELPEDERLMIDSDLRMIEAVDRKIAALEARLSKLAHESAGVRLLMSLPGVDYGVAQTLLAAFGDLSRFPDGDHAAAYLGLVPSTRQSADRCHHGPITKAGNNRARWMLTQAAQRVADNPGPLGVFFRRLAKRKNHNVAVTATARKMAAIAYLMLRNNEPYRYAKPEATQEKLVRLRVRVTGARRKASPPKTVAGKPRTPGTKLIPSPAEVYASEGLPPAKAPDKLAVGEKRMLKTTRTEAFAQEVQRPQEKPRATKSPAPKPPAKPGPKGRARE